MIRRVFLIVVDSMGCGNAPDAADFGDAGANTLATIRRSKEFYCPNMEKLGLFHIAGFSPDPAAGGYMGKPVGSFGRFRELSAGKDTTAGHWEIAGLVTEKPFPHYPDGFPEEIIRELEKRTGRKILCNRPYSGTEVIRDYGMEQMKTGALIVYTSADSVLQIAAHEDVIPVEELYQDCRIARELMQGEHGVGRVIARPYVGTSPENFTRTPRRHDFSLVPTGNTILRELQAAGLSSIGIGKIRDIFAGDGIDDLYSTATTCNEDGMDTTLALSEVAFRGLCFVNLVETDQTYGHRRDIDGYAACVSAFDRRLGELMEMMLEDDVVMITADHGCDPGYTGTDHTRELVPFLVYGAQVKAGVDLGTRDCFGCIGRTVLGMLGVTSKNPLYGEDLTSLLLKPVTVEDW